MFRKFVLIVILSEAKNLSRTEVKRFFATLGMTGSEEIIDLGFKFGNIGLLHYHKVKSKISIYWLKA